MVVTSRLATGRNSVGKETQNRNKFNAVSPRSSTLHSFSPFPSSPSPPPFLLFFSAHVHKACHPNPSIYTPHSQSLPMLLASLAVLISASASTLAQQTQIAYDSAHNVTPITGTWSSGAMNVVTGAVRICSCSCCGTYSFGPNGVAIRKC